MADSDKTKQAGATVHYESSRKKRSRKGGAKNMQPPLTPMIDVVFQLLLFFLLSCQFRPEEGVIPARLPSISSDQPTPSVKVDPINVTLRAAGDNGKGVIIEISNIHETVNSAARLHGYLQLLQNKIQNGKKVPVVIKPTGKVRWLHVVDAFNQALRLQFETIGFAPADS